MQWLRWHHGTVNDPKWRLVARRSGQPVHAVLAVWAAMLEAASGGDERGKLEGWDDEVVGVGLDLAAEVVASIREAMQGLVLAENALTGWEKRNPKREDETAAERMRRHRERQRDALRTVTDGDDESRGATRSSTDEIRREEKREKETTTTTTTAPVAAAVGNFCERTGTAWRLAESISDWAGRIQREPKYAGVDFIYEIGRCAEWHEGKRKTPKAPDQAIRNWLEIAGENLKKQKENGHDLGPTFKTQAQLLAERYGYAQ